MQEKIKSKGRCVFCGELFTKAGINRHLTGHLKEIAKTEKEGSSFLVKVEADKRWGAAPYFLSLWVDGEASMKNIDKFLRAIWLECCGHLSRFHGAGMTKKAKDALYQGLELGYEYDFGSTTELTLTVVDEYPVKADKKIVLLSRNEPLQIMCDICGKAPATRICSVCMDEESAAFCDQCAPKHAEGCDDFADYASMPIVNSPRMGVCGYTGGSIDLEREIFKSVQ